MTERCTYCDKVLPDTYVSQELKPYCGWDCAEMDGIMPPKEDDVRVTVMPARDYTYKPTCNVLYEAGKQKILAGESPLIVDPDPITGLPRGADISIPMKPYEAEFAPAPEVKGKKADKVWVDEVPQGVWDNFHQQERASLAFMKHQLRELDRVLDKHNLVATNLVHDCIELEGRPEDLKAAYGELLGMFEGTIKLTEAEKSKLEEKKILSTCPGCGVEMRFPVSKLPEVGMATCADCWTPTPVYGSKAEQIFIGFDPATGPDKTVVTYHVKPSAHDERVEELLAMKLGGTPVDPVDVEGEIEWVDPGVHVTELDVPGAVKVPVNLSVSVVPGPSAKEAGTRIHNEIEARLKSGQPADEAIAEVVEQMRELGLTIDPEVRKQKETVIKAVRDACTHIIGEAPGKTETPHELPFVGTPVKHIPLWKQDPQHAFEREFACEPPRPPTDEERETERRRALSRYNANDARMTEDLYLLAYLDATDESAVDHHNNPARQRLRELYRKVRRFAHLEAQSVAILVQSVGLVAACNELESRYYVYKRKHFAETYGASEKTVSDALHGRVTITARFDSFEPSPIHLPDNPEMRLFFEVVNGCDKVKGQRFFYAWIADGSREALFTLADIMHALGVPAKTIKRLGELRVMADITDILRPLVGCTCQVKIELKREMGSDDYNFSVDKFLPPPPQDGGTVHGYFEEKFAKRLQDQHDAKLDLAKVTPRDLVAVLDRTGRSPHTTTYRVAEYSGGKTHQQKMTAAYTIVMNRVREAIEPFLHKVMTPDLEASIRTKISQVMGAFGVEELKLTMTGGIVSVEPEWAVDRILRTADEIKRGDWVGLNSEGLVVPFGSVYQDPRLIAPIGIVKTPPRGGGQVDIAPISHAQVQRWHDKWLENHPAMADWMRALATSMAAANRTIDERVASVHVGGPVTGRWQAKKDPSSWMVYPHNVQPEFNAWDKDLQELALRSVSKAEVSKPTDLVKRNLAGPRCAFVPVSTTEVKPGEQLFRPIRSAETMGCTRYRQSRARRFIDAGELLRHGDFWRAFPDRWLANAAILFDPKNDGTLEKMAPSYQHLAERPRNERQYIRYLAKVFVQLVAEGVPEYGLFSRMNVMRDDKGSPVFPALKASDVEHWWTRWHAAVHQDGLLPVVGAIGARVSHAHEERFLRPMNSKLEDKCDLPTDPYEKSRARNMELQDELVRWDLHPASTIKDGVDIELPVPVAPGYDCQYGEEFEG